MAFSASRVTGPGSMVWSNILKTLHPAGCSIRIAHGAPSKDSNMPSRGASLMAEPFKLMSRNGFPQEPIVY
jgi:hypothetical protein